MKQYKPSFSKQGKLVFHKTKLLSILEQVSIDERVGADFKCEDLFPNMKKKKSQNKIDSFQFGKIGHFNGNCL